ncbi:hypothetical protein C6P40_004742 [Pichia californica]|uniref:Histone chaperone RTT106 n=1 Tax=Pichia californica TaxID=460514 RepID=A0A9P6WQB9_9ASCO|nr:hypothetical protein C6P42_004088 [[Candida] californica]KAG0691136.1 hypothetical protein C6P40_004742 [[Candida] californica]
MNSVGKNLETLPADLKAQITKFINENPSSEKVFESLIEYYENKVSNIEGNDSKRKKTDNPFKNVVNESMESAITTLKGANVMLQLPDLSIQSPFRKRLNLVFGAFKGEKKAFLALTKSIESKPELLLRELTSNNVKFSGILNVPEKKPLRYMLIEYISNDGNVFKNDPLLIQFNNDQLEEQFGSILGGKSFVQYLTSQLKLIDFNVFDGTSDDVFSVDAYKGNKEGYLYFLQNYVIFGFKKPIHIFNSTDIESITYNSITRLTFNILLNVKIYGVIEHFEFSMIDQKEFENIDKYVKTKDFRDNSMAEQYKAQKQLKNNTETPSDLAEAAKLVPGGDQLIPSGGMDDDDDDEDDDNYEVGDSDDDHSDASGAETNTKTRHEDEDDDDDDEDDEDDEDNDDEDEDEANDTNYTKGFTSESIGTIDSFKAFEDNLQDELLDLQNDLDIDINELRKQGYIDM